MRLSSRFGLIILLLSALSCHRSVTTEPTSAPATSASTSSDLITEENRGVALTGKFDFDGAVAVFSQIQKEHPENADNAVNLAIATLNRQREGDSAAALQMLDAVLRDHPDQIRAHYCRGVLLLNAGKPAEALKEFQWVASKDASDAFAAYWMGQSLAAMGKPGEALPEFLKAEELKPTLRSAYYGAFQAMQKLGRMDEAKKEFAKFQDLKDNPQAQLVEFKYTRMGPKAEARVPDSAVPAVAVSLPNGPVFGDAQPLKLNDSTGVVWNRIQSDQHPSITAADIDGDGKLDLFIANAGMTIDGQPRNAVLLQRDNGGWELARDHPLAKVAHVNAALWGDFDNDGLTDVYLCRSSGGNQLWRQTKPGQWEDVTASTATAGPGGNTIDGAFVDADHDGDLDLFLIRSDGTNVLLNSDGNGHFRDISAQAGIGGDGSGAVGLVVNDLDHDGDVDFLVLKKSGLNEVYLNDLGWHFHKGGAEWRDLLSTPMDAAIAADGDADGKMEIYGVCAPNNLLRWEFSDGAWHSSQVLHNGIAAWPLSIQDINGTGRLRLMYATDRGVGAVDISSKPHPEVLVNFVRPAVGFAAVVIDAGRGPSLVGLGDRGVPMIWSPGSGRLNFAAIQLSGKNRESDQMRSNASGVGVKLAARIGDHWTAVDTYRNQSGPGQSDEPISVGLRGAASADFIRLTWPEGLQQTEMAVAAGGHRIEETQRQTSSCPVIFAWDGKRFAFVTDCLGVGGIGFAVGPDQYAPVRPKENVMLPANLLRPRDGNFVIKLGEPMEEACYLDAASLASYDLPPGWGMTLDERMATGDPAPTSEPRFYRQMMLPSRAVNDRGEDVSGDVRSVDYRAADPGPVDPHFIGRLLREHVLTMSFDRAIDSGPGQPMLIADGWIEYPYSQTMFAAWQAGATYDAPTIEARGSDGAWVTVLPQFGYPAGMPREMSVPIPREKLPRRCREIRIRTTMEIYFDRLAIAWSEPCPAAVKRVLPMRSANVAAGGFALRTTAAQRRPIYDYDRRVPLWDTHFQDGFYTAFGEATELVRAVDDAVCIFGPGEEVDMNFAAGSPSLAEGWSRQYVLELAGWCKDRDPYTKDGKTIEPLPRREGVEEMPAQSGARDALQAKFNTRWMSEGD